MINAPNAILNDETWCTHFPRGSFQHILIQILTTVLLEPSLPNGYLLTTSLQKAVQSRRVRGESQLLYTRSRVVMQGFLNSFSCFPCTRTPFLLRLPIECLLGKLIQQALFTNSVRVLTAMPQRRTDLPLIFASDTDLPEQFKPWLKLFPKSKAFFPNQLQKLILQALTMVLCTLLSAIGRCRNHRCGGQKPGLWWRLK